MANSQKIQVFCNKLNALYKREINLEILTEQVRHRKVYWKMAKYMRIISLPILTISKADII